MKLSNKKGFTIVELVVVVAVIAILAAVLIPTVSGIIAKARLNADQQAVSNMNKAVAMGAAEDEFLNAGDAVDALYAYGFNNGKLETYSSDFHYAYDFENNKFYLLNAEDKVVFPENEEVSVSNLWGFFNNKKADAIVGVTKYIALSGIHDANTFGGDDCVFAGTETEYTLDLNKRYIGLEGKANVKLVNGSVKADSAFTLGATVAEKAVATSKNFAGEVKDTVITSAVKANTYTATGAVTFKDCAFDFTTNTDGYATFKGADSYVFENCTLIFNDGNFFVDTKGATDVTFKNCYIASGRGIVIGGNATAASGNKFGDIVIEGNTFVCTNPSLGRPFIQFAGNKQTNINSLTADAITIKDNTFDCTDIVIRIHDTLNTINCSAISITGNVFNEKAVKIDGDGKEASQAIADSWIIG